jgi:sialate O-acetylesterase
MNPPPSRMSFLKKTIATTALLLNLSSAAWAEATLWLPGMFGDNMVLQREMPVPVWGRAEPGSTVSVTLYDGETKLAGGETVAAADTGRWRVDLPALTAGEGRRLVVESRDLSRTFENVMVGEVWIVCGQSNMGMNVGSSAEREDAATHRGEYPMIRFVSADRGGKTHEITEPQEDVGGGKWRNTAANAGSLSAVGYFFARELARWFDRKVPVGIISVVAILPVQSWIDVPELASAPQLASLKGRPYPSATSRAFMANISPLAPYAVRGVVYYQGEMNGGNGPVFYHGIKALMASWRRVWNNPDMPFLVVQLPGFISHQAGKTELDMDAASLAEFDGKNQNHGFIPVREALLRASREDPRLGMAVTLDLGEKFDIHPPRKRAVGERLALQARKIVYGDAEVLADSPVPRDFRREGDAFIVSFDGVGGGLKAREELKGFEVADAAGAWHPAEAVIRGDNTLAVRAAKVPEPAGVRYAWLGYPEVTLFNKEGLPASPFQFPLSENFR